MFNGSGSKNERLNKHEQELYVKIHASKIPLKTYKAEGNIAIDTNGGKHIIPFKIFLKNYEKGRK
jgi:hypothetical protein